MKKRVPFAVLAAATMLEGGSAALAAPALHTGALSTRTTHKYKGPTVQMPWGPVRAVVYVKGKKITKVVVLTSPQTNRSQFIDEQAAPLLQQETLHAQNAKIDAISGATMTSEAYIQSLQAIVKKARQDKLLK
jgi:uncharacterized protein with FMN-binding domain